MKANVGDELIVGETEICGAPRVGTIVSVMGSDGSPPYLVHWVAGDYDSLVSPWPAVQVRHKRTHLAKKPPGTRAVRPCPSAARA
jgi:Domain of unknown function (DUF1918)